MCIFSDIFFSKLHSSSFLLCTIRTFFRRNENGNGETYFFRREKNHLGKINEGAFFILYAISLCYYYETLLNVRLRIGLVELAAKEEKYSKVAQQQLSL